MVLTVIFSMETLPMLVTSLFPAMKQVALLLRLVMLSQVLLLVTKLLLILIRDATSATIVKTQILIFVKLEVSTMGLELSEMAVFLNSLLRQLSQFTKFRKILILSISHWSSHFHALFTVGVNYQMGDRFFTVPKCLFRVQVSLFKKIF